MADGGNVEFVEIDGLTVRLKLAGACGSCPSSLTTMTMGIKRRLMEKIPVGCFFECMMVLFDPYTN
jgi:Fe-S cluster biogenesis protein NfuA